MTHFVCIEYLKTDCIDEIYTDCRELKESGGVSYKSDYFPVGSSLTFPVGSSLTCANGTLCGCDAFSTAYYNS